MIQPITVTFDTTAATDALQKLARAALEKPDLVNGIAQIKDHLFDCRADYENFHEQNPHRMTIAIYPSEVFRAFLKALTVTKHSEETAERVAPPFDELSR